MTNDALLVLETVFSTIWRLFTSWHIPGTNVTPAVAFAFFLVVAIGLKFIGRLFGVGIDESGKSRSVGSISDRLTSSNGDSHVNN